MLAMEFVKQTGDGLMIEIIGWIGSALVVTAYALTVKGGRNSLSLCNYFNLVGAAFVAVNCYYHTSLPSLFLNIIWMLIAFLGVTNHKHSTK